MPTLARTLLLTLFAVACSARSVGGTSDGSGGTSDGSGGSTGDDAFAMMCDMGCTHVEDCDPDGFGQIYASHEACVVACQNIVDTPIDPAACPDDATAYYQCNLGLSCAEVMQLLMNPANTECGDEFDAFAASCGV